MLIYNSNLAFPSIKSALKNMELHPDISAAITEPPEVTSKQSTPSKRAGHHKFLDVMSKKGSKITDFKPISKPGLYSLHVETADGDRLHFNSISETHMKEFGRFFINICISIFRKELL